MLDDSHLRGTYRQLRLMAGTTLIAVPVAIVLVAWLRHQIILPTLSHYYFSETDPGFIRTMFTGFLVLVGGIMMAYRGFDPKDNWIHNFAGVFAICVAMFPKRCDKFDISCVPTELWILHLPSAVLLGLVAAYAVWYSGGPSLKSRLTPHEVKILKRWRTGALLGMGAGIVAYVPFAILGGFTAIPLTAVLTIEMMGFFGFAFYWIGMTYVISTANDRINSARSTATLDRRAGVAVGEPLGERVKGRELGPDARQIP